MNQPYNILIAGVGGQGVMTLTKVITGLAHQYNKKSISAIYKGGAQRLGTIHSIIRIFSDEADHSLLSAQIPGGKLDLLLGFEPWEALRHHKLFSMATSLIVNTRPIPLLSRRNQLNEELDPAAALISLGCPLIMKDFDLVSEGKNGTNRMMNFELGLQSIVSGHLTFSKEDFKKMFVQIVNDKKAVVHEL